MITRTRVAVLVALVAITAAGWATSSVVSKDATEDSSLQGPTVVRLLVSHSAPCPADRIVVSVVVDQLADSTDPRSYPLLGLQAWSFVLHYDPALLRFIDDSALSPLPVLSEERIWTLWPDENDERNGTARITVTSEPRNRDLPLAGALRPGGADRLTLATLALRSVAPGASHITVDDINLIPVGDAKIPLPPPAPLDAAVTTSCAA
jgi:hypothetical protein